ncbi:MAG TPA: signal peptidase I [Chthonomonadaceae bacterium]|nr:signal peptidase I [Chthonomonadaceae bacterium]
MHCKQVRPLLNALADGELNFWQRLRVTRHLRGCAACAAEAEVIRQLGAEASAWRGVTAPNSLEARIAAAIAANPEPAPSSPTLASDRRSHSQEDPSMHSPSAAPFAIPRSLAWRWQTLVVGLVVFALTLTVCARVYFGHSSLRGLEVVNWLFSDQYLVPSESMEPTLMGHEDRTVFKDGHDVLEAAVHDVIRVDQWAYRHATPQRADIIVFKAPPGADQESLALHQPPKENTLIKRIIGLPGDTIEVKPSPDGSRCLVYINGKPLEEPYIKEPMDKDQPSIARFATQGPLVLKPGQYFVLGDNRNNSNDSRFWGVLVVDRVLGKVTGIAWPLHRRRSFP